MHLWHGDSAPFDTAGSQLLFLVPDTIWVTANFKETQTSVVRIGQRADFSIDGLEDQRFTGTVEQMSPATSSEFSVLRSDNATGKLHESGPAPADTHRH